MLDELIILRTIERLVAITIGGLAIWFGYRLFLAVPDQSADGQAELTISKNQRLLVSRIGPGTFFALFGSAVVIVSLVSAVTLQTSQGDSYTALGPRQNLNLATSAENNSIPILPLSDAEMNLTLVFLNEIEQELAATDPQNKHGWREQRFKTTRLSILARNWQQNWGDFAEFELWLKQSPPRSNRPEFTRAKLVMDGKG